MKRNTLYIVFLLAANYLFAQDCNKTLSGRVIDFHDGVSLEGATITFNSTTVKTDSNGMYKLTGLCATSYAFTISHEDCNSQVVTIDLNEVSSKDFYLEHHFTNLEEVDVASSGQKKTTNSQTEDRLSRKQLDQYSSLSIGDALQEISGVNSLTSGNTIVKPVIQGLHSSRIIIINNGVRQEDQEWGEEHSPNLDINAFNELKVIKGAGALQYGGNAIGGVIIAENKLTTLQDTIFGKAQLALSSNGRGGGINSALNLGFKDGWGAKFQGTVKHFGDSEAPDYVLSNTGHREQSFSTGFGYNDFTYGFEGYYSFFNTSQGILRASHIGNVGDLVRAINSSEPLVINDFTYDINAPKQETQHHLAKLKAYKRFQNLGKLNVQYSFQYNNRKEFDIRRGDDRDKASLDLELVTHNLESSFLFDSNDDFTKNIGFQYTYQINTPNPETGIRRLIPDYNKMSAGVFAITEFNISENLKADLGARYDFVNIDAKKFYRKDFWDERGYNAEFADLIIADEGDQWLTNPNFDYHSVSASAGINYLYGNQNSLLFNVSFANRAPNPVELFSDGLHHSAAIIELGDLRFDQEKALKFSLSSAHQDLFGVGSLTVSPHLSSIQDFILLEPTGLEFTIRGAFPVWEYTQTNAILYGVDIDYGVSITDYLKFNTSFSYIYGQDTEADEALINMPAPNFRSELIYERERWNLKLKNHSVLEQTRFPDNNFETDFIENGVEQTALVDVSTTPAGYSIFDISGSYVFDIWNRKDLTVGMSITNMFDTNYRDYLNRQRYYADNVGRNFTLNINFKF
ncbi:TonB-dependent receptor [Aquimarina sp. 2201CG14-23]|uniref:TonB-dependent receptor n=1 Tax=Aquimarina mycalae TaxID=3040073 RepID=UPI002477DDEC|nr:TonB-dependent receptor [Aquimarina sp. 2201CG14-23]MDH7446231.1 TonB-dependent receptor [Aquimarina sp. 2201CG14-23]